MSYFPQNFQHTFLQSILYFTFTSENNDINITQLVAKVKAKLCHREMHQPSMGFLVSFPPSTSLQFAFIPFLFVSFLFIISCVVVYHVKYNLFWTECPISWAMWRFLYSCSCNSLQDFRAHCIRISHQFQLSGYSKCITPQTTHWSNRVFHCERMCNNVCISLNAFIYRHTFYRWTIRVSFRLLLRFMITWTMLEFYIYILYICPLKLIVKFDVRKMQNDYIWPTIDGCFLMYKLIGV